MTSEHSPIYLIGGLGADERVFSKLELHQQSIFMDWIEPMPNESFQSYAGRFAERITQPNPILVGVSFGGLLAQEVAAIRPVEKIVLISSATTSSALPPALQLVKSIPFEKLFTPQLLKNLIPLPNYLFGVQRPEHAKLLSEIIDDTNPDFLKWALGVLRSWQPPAHHVKHYSLHGTKDHLLRCLQPDVAIQDAGHFMIVTHAAEVSLFVRAYLSDKTQSSP